MFFYLFPSTWSTHLCWFVVTETKEAIEDRTETNLVNLRHTFIWQSWTLLSMKRLCTSCLKLCYRRVKRSVPFFPSCVNEKTDWPYLRLNWSTWSLNLVPKKVPTLHSTDLLTNVSVNSTKSGRTALKMPLIGTTLPSTDTKPTACEISLDSLDNSLVPTPFHGWCLSASRSTKMMQQVVVVFSSRLWCKRWWKEWVWRL